MKNEKDNTVRNIAIVLGVCIFCILGFYLLTVNHGEGDPYFVFTEVPVNETLNSSVIHLRDTDIMNIRGLDVRQENGKIIRIYVRYSQTKPEINALQFNEKYGSSYYNLSLRKYLEYRGVYYYANEQIP